MVSLRFDGALSSDLNRSQAILVLHLKYSPVIVHSVSIIMANDIMGSASLLSPPTDVPSYVTESDDLATDEEAVIDADPDCAFYHCPPQVQQEPYHGPGKDADQPGPLSWGPPIVRVQVWYRPVAGIVTENDSEEEENNELYRFKKMLNFR